MINDVVVIQQPMFVNMKYLVTFSILSVFSCLLISGPLCAAAQEGDSVLQAELMASLATREAKVAEWNQSLNHITSVLDSTKRRRVLERSTPDTTALDSMLSQLAVAKKQIAQHIEEIKATRTMWRATSPPPDTIAGFLAVDSLRQLVNGAVDTLSRLEGGFQRLMGELVYLEQTARRQREERIAARVDSVAAGSIPVPRRVVKTVRTNLGRDGSSVAFFDLPAWSNRLFLILLSLLYTYWIYRLGRKREGGDSDLRMHENEPLWIPILKGLLLFLVLLPLTSFSVPVLVLEGSYLLIFVFFLIILYRELAVVKRRQLVVVLFFYLVLIAANLVLSDTWWSRGFAMLVNASGAALLWYLRRDTLHDGPVGRIHRYARWAIFFGYLLAVATCAMGYVHIARMWSLAAGIGLLQALSFAAFRDMLLHDLQHQYRRSATDATIRRFDLARMLDSFDRLIRLVCASLVVIVFLNNLHLTREAGGLVERLLMSEHKIGGVVFTYGNLLLAILVVWAANWLQQNLKRLVDGPTAEGQQGRRLTLFPLLRLLIVVVGFLIGVSILGLGVDKLTVIIGALSVGIGLGLQNIINNFVSGIILVFEKPFKLGDYIELADKKGQVMQIGIRSSTLLTDQGARVIIPNGDLLSGRLVNWTFSDADIRVNMQLTVDSGMPIEEVKQLVLGKLTSFSEVDRSIPIKVFTRDVTADGYVLAIQVGITNVRFIERFRSQFLEALKSELDGRQVKVSSS